MVVSFFLSMYYNVINAWAFWYLFHSFQVRGCLVVWLSPMEDPKGFALVLDIAQLQDSPRHVLQGRSSVLWEKLRARRYAWLQQRW